MMKLKYLCPGLGVVFLAMSVTAQADQVTVTQTDRKFSAPYISINPGDKVEFANTDTVTHNVYSTTPGAEFDLGKFAPGNKQIVSFSDKVPVVDVQCSIHPNMKMTVFVNIDWRKTLNEAMRSGSR